MQYYAISDLELRQFHMAGLVAGGGDAVLPVVDGIRERKISYANESQKPSHKTCIDAIALCKDMMFAIEADACCKENVTVFKKRLKAVV